MQQFTRTGNPALSDAAMQRAAQDLQPGWGAPTGYQAPGGAPGARPDTMTMGGVATATGVLLALCVVAAYFGWQQVDEQPIINAQGQVIGYDTTIPGWIFIPVLVGLGVAILTVFRPNLARFTAPVYALLQGVFLGAISAVYNAAYDGIVLQAVLCTLGVFLVMLFLYATRIIKVTKKLMIAVVAATMGIFLTYLVTWIWSMFTDSTPAIYEAGPLGIGFSVLVVGIAAFNLLLDFDFIERGTEAGLPKGMEWYAAFGLLVTLIWLYIEILRLLSKLRR